jgi:ribosomal protein S12 methylthiotransferase accessory factor
MTRTAVRSILDLWPDLVDPHTGVVREVVEFRIDDDDPPFVHYLSTASNTEAFGYLPNFGNNGGAAATARAAIAKALGEAVERYCAAFFRPDDLIYSRHGDLHETATHPDGYALYTSAQYAAPGFPWRPFDSDTTVAWTRGISLVTGETTLVPAAYVYVPYRYQRSRSETPITQPISTGLACGTSLQDATLTALCEVIERDAFTITWQARLSRPRIQADSLPVDLMARLDRFRSVGLTVHLIDITTDIACPTVLTVAEGFTPTSPAVAVAAAAHPDPDIAMRKSLEELAHTRKFASQCMDFMPPVPVDIENEHPAVDDQRAHLRFYCPQEAKPLAEFAWAGTEEICLRDIRTTTSQTLDALVADVAATGQDIIAVDLTTSDVAELGLHVVRVVVPGLHPLHMGHAFRCRGGDRLATIPLHLGASDWSPERDNPYPHPFP